MGAGLGLDQLQSRTDGVGGGVGRAAQQGVGLAHLDEHGAEVVGLLQGGGAVLGAHLALAELDHLFDHGVELGVVLGVDYLKTLNVEAALGGRSLDLVDVADQHGGEEAAGLEAGRTLEYTGVGALGVNYLAGVLLENFHEIFKHSFCASIYPALRRGFLDK